MTENIEAKQEGQVAEKKSRKPWIIGCSIGVVLFLVVLCIVGVLTAILIPTFMAASK